MNSRLNRIRNWPALAQTANYCAKALARQVGVSRRHLQRFFLETQGTCPHQWLNEVRQKHALELLRDGSSVKEAAAELGYKQAAHFSREFKRFCGFAPGHYAKSVQLSQNVPLR